MSDDRKLPVERRDQAPVDRGDEARLPAPPGANGGLIKQGFSRLWAKLGRGTTDDNTELVKSQDRYVDAYGKLADTAYETKRKVDRLRYDLPSQLDTDRVQHTDKMEAARHDIALNKEKRTAELAAFKSIDERDRMTRDLDYMKAASDKRRVLHHAARQEIDAKVRRDTFARTADMQIEQAIKAFKTGDYAALDKFMRAKHGFEQAWGDNQAQAPTRHKPQPRTQPSKSAWPSFKKCWRRAKPRTRRPSSSSSCTRRSMQLKISSKPQQPTTRSHKKGRPLRAGQSATPPDVTADLQLSSHVPSLRNTGRSDLLDGVRLLMSLPAFYHVRLNHKVCHERPRARHP